ncbi:MAG: GTPase HflX [Thermoplasmata archaeon]|nr:MAG: GTPase HflX [Deltaproteobacteria bacterium]RLF61847.1 MAG: GTPase HflX [Thermoplasmata archaeon]
MNRVHGKTRGLKASHQKRLQSLYRRRVPPSSIISHELSRRLSEISREIKRQVGLLINRKGEIAYVLVGNSKRIWIPELGKFRMGTGRLKGLRCVHTHLDREPLSPEDITDLVLIGLDLIASIEVDQQGLPGPITYAHLLPGDQEQKGYLVERVPDIGRLTVDFLSLIQSLEEELGRKRIGPSLGKRDRALLVGVTSGPKWLEEESMRELEKLALSNDIEVVGLVTQRVKRIDPRFLMGRGRLRELMLHCLQTGSDLLIFNQELTPAQVKILTDFTELRIIDRSQLILDIFARRAVTREGKIQVELAQLKYLVPRLATKNTAMSRLTGGIGGRGPGETKLEINRRRVYTRIARLNRELANISRQRQGRRQLRGRRGVPVISIVGYTNAGKSTLLNSLTGSDVGTGARLFETLDPSSRRLRFPREREAIITDTVGFIRDLPKSLMEAFAATLEELNDADLLLHVVDASSKRMDDEIKTVEDILRKLHLRRIPVLVALNKMDRVEQKKMQALQKRTGGVSISAIHPPSLRPLVKKIEKIIWKRSSNLGIS